ncbi:hypothetical protein [uncultured Fibrella sp.]|uniref:hypothetical protein n=1 Tax=uncultured Fibrella sp. TaxID=1284596 RepID=UPI0035CBEFA7
MTTSSKKTILLPISSDCPNDPASVAKRIKAFREARPLSNYTRQVKNGTPSAPYCLEFPLEKIKQLIASPGCEGVRVYFILEDFPLDNPKSAISLAMVCYDGDRDDIVSLDPQLFPENALECCGSPPPTGGTKITNLEPV